MKEIRDVRLTFAEVRSRLGIDRPPGFFKFLIRRLGLKDVRIDGDALVYASFVPVELMLKESAHSLEAEGVRAVPCEKCGDFHDAEHEDGIFRDPQRLEGFVCKACAEKMTAFDYYTNWLKT